MPTKNKKTHAKKQQPRTAKRATRRVPVERQMANLAIQDKSNNVTDLGRLLLNGGNMLGGLFGFNKIFGSGAYAMKQNSVFDVNQQVPVMHSTSETVRLRHREYIGDVNASATFSANTYACNPGLNSSFPYLAQVAQNFQEYTFKGLVYEFKTTSASAIVSGTNTAMGSVCLAFQYRADAAPFANKQQLLNEMWSVDTVPSSNVVLPVECAPDENPFAVQYVRGVTSVTGDIKMYDLGTLTVATVGFQTGQTNIVGELWASYDVELRKPQVSSSLGINAPTAIATSTDYSNTSLFGVTTQSTINTVPAGVIGNNLYFNLGLAGAPPNAYAQGYYLISLTWVGSGAAVLLMPSFTAASGLVIVDAIGSTNGDTSRAAFYQALVYVPFISTSVLANQPQLQLGGSPVLPTGTRTFTMTINQMYYTAYTGQTYP